MPDENPQSPNEISFPEGLLSTEPEEVLALTSSLVPVASVQRLDDGLRRGMDLVLLGTTQGEAAKKAKVKLRALNQAINSDFGREYMAVQEATLATWMRGLLMKATAVFNNELAGPDRLRAADLIFKHLGKVLGQGDDDDMRVLDATAFAKAILAEAQTLKENNVIHLNEER